MSKSREDILQTLLDTVESFGSLLGQLGDRVEALETAVPGLEGPLGHAVTDGAISTIFIGMLLAEVSDGDQSRFDQLMAKTATFAEAQTRHLDTRTTERVLACIDRVVGVADDHFARSR